VGTQVEQAEARWRDTRDAQDQHGSVSDRKPQMERPDGFQTGPLPKPNLLSWRSRFQAIYLGFVRQNSSPDKMAKGLALGVFLGIFPTFGADPALALLASSRLGWNCAAAVLGTLIANPLLNPFFLSLSVIAGNLVLPSEFRFVLENFRQGDGSPGLLSLLPTYFAGNLLVSTLIGALAYAAGLIAVTKYRKHRTNHSRQTRTVEL
jgi:uncharacterized protein (DUF2062 family)